MDSSLKTTWIGQSLEEGRFLLQEKLGEGGMAVVFKAWDNDALTEVVVKVPKQNSFEDAASLKRFAKESQALIALRHPQIVRIFHVGHHRDWPFTVMQYLPGGDLDACRRTFGGKLSLLNISLWVPAIAGALDFVHGRGYIHRDVKPANILFDGQGQGFLSDFGIAKGSVDSKMSKLTGTGQLLGTPDYMAPELIMGKPIDGRVDQYALAITIYECLAGRAPFDGAVPGAVLVKHTMEIPPALDEVNPDIPPAVAQIIAKALAKDPDDRFPSCSALAGHLVERATTPDKPFLQAATVPATPAFEKSTRQSHRDATQPQAQPARTNRTQSPPPVPPLPPSPGKRKTRRKTTTSTQRGTRSTQVNSRRPVVAPVVGKSPLEPLRSFFQSRPNWQIWGMGIGAVMGLLVLVFLASSRPNSAPSPVATSPENDAQINAKKEAPIPQNLLVRPTGNFQINEGTLLAVPLGMKPDQPQAGKFLYRIEGTPPAGLQVNELTGELSWIPREDQGPGTYPVILSARDDAEIERARQTYTIQVNEVNTPPVLTVPDQVDVNPKAGLKLPLSIVDYDQPANNIQISWEGPVPQGLEFDSKTGLLTWEADSTLSLTGTHQVQVLITDDGTPPQSVAKEIQFRFTSIDISEIPKQTIPERLQLRLPIQAKIAGQPTAALTYRLADPIPSGSSLNSRTGEFQWTAPAGSAGTLQEVTVEVALASNPAIRGVVEFQIEVESRSPTGYWDLPELPNGREAPQEVVLWKDKTLSGGPVSLKLLGFDSLSPQVVSQTGDEARQIAAFYRTPAGSLDKDLPPLQELGKFFLKDEQLVFLWAEHKDSQVRKYQQLLREAVLQIQTAGQPAKSYALKSPVEFPAVLLESALSEPYDEKRICRFDTLPTKVSRNLLFEGVQVHFSNDDFQTGRVASLESTTSWSFPRLASAMSLRTFRLVFEEKPADLVWRIETTPSIHESYEKHRSLSASLSSAEKNLRKSAKDYSKNSAAANAASSNPKLRLDRLSYEKKAATAYKDATRFQAEVIRLQPLSSAATTEYLQLKAPLKQGEAGRVSLSVYRMVDGLRLRVLTVNKH